MIRLKRSRETALCSKETQYEDSTNEINLLNRRHADARCRERHRRESPGPTAIVERRPRQTGHPGFRQGGDRQQVRSQLCRTRGLTSLPAVKWNLSIRGKIDLGQTKLRILLHIWWPIMRNQLTRTKTESASTGFRS